MGGGDHEDGHDTVGMEGVGEKAPAAVVVVAAVEKEEEQGHGKEVAGTSEKREDGADVEAKEEKEKEEEKEEEEKKEDVGANAAGSAWRLLTLAEAKELKQCAFGAYFPGFIPDQWRQQGFVFNPEPGLEYGLLQKTSGPCGLIAAVQAHILRHLHFSSLGADASQRYLLKMAIFDILVRIAQGGPVVITRTTAADASAAHNVEVVDNFTETVETIACTNHEAILLALDECLDEYMRSEGGGAVLLLYAAILTRGIARLVADMEQPSSLVTEEAFCYQEMVNLLLSGSAVSNVCNQEMAVVDGVETLSLKGIPARCDVGMLMLYEYFGFYRVGEHLKSPQFPIWLLHVVNHYSVVFGKSLDILQTQLKFRLEHYDPLANQRSHMKVDVFPEALAPAHEDDLSPLDQCILTRWPLGRIRWL